MPNSYRPMVKTAGDKDWVGNALRFATREEAEAEVRALWRRWTLVRETDVHESDDQPNAVFEDGARRLLDR